MAVIRLYMVNLADGIPPAELHSWYQVTTASNRSKLSTGHRSSAPESSKTGKALAALIFGTAFFTLGLGLWLLFKSALWLGLAILGIVCFVVGLFKKQEAANEVTEFRERER